MMRGFGFGARYRQSKYGSNYERENNDYYPNWGWVALALLFLSPFIAAFLLNPYMWLMVFLIWVAYKIIYGKGE